MEKIKLGRSGISVTPIAFGAWAIGGWMWGGTDRNEALDALDASIDMGITTIDTAPVYGFGRSEELVGKAVKGKRDRVEILTKYGLRWDTTQGEHHFDSVDNQGKPVKIHKFASPESIIRECEASLKRLGTDYIDLYQIHWADPTTPISETMQAVQSLIDQGKVRAAGVCNYSAARCREASESILLASNQVPYSMLNRTIEKEVVPWCISNNTSVLAYSPLQRGLLTGKIQPGHLFNKGDSRSDLSYFSDENIEKVNGFLGELLPLAREKDVTPGQLVLAWTLQQPGISVALVGARNRKQVVENAGAGGLKLGSDEINLIDQSLSQINLVL